MPSWVRLLYRCVLAALAVALIVMLTVRVGTREQAPSAAPDPIRPSVSATPSITPPASPEPEQSTPPADPEPPPAPPAGGGGGTGGGTTSSRPAFVSFTATPSSFACSPPSEGEFTPSQSITVTLAWRSTNAQEAWIGVETADAEFSPYESVATNTNSYQVYLNCPVRAVSNWTVTLKGPDGKTSKTVTLTNTGYTG